MIKNKEKYAILKIKGKQYVAHEGEELLVDLFNGKNVDIDVYLLVNKGKVKLGKPKLSDVKIKYKKLEDIKDKKLYIQQYKAKSRSRRKIGFRKKLSKILIEKIT